MLHLYKHKISKPFTHIYKITGALIVIRDILVFSTSYMNTIFENDGDI